MKKVQKLLKNHSIRYKYKIRSEINVTPFVDVMLVLLVIFMLTSNMSSISGIDIELPNSAENFSEKSITINISIDKKSRIFLQEEVVKKEDLLKKITAVLKEKPKIQILLHGDKDANYGKIIEIFNILRQASIYNVTLVTEQE